MYLIIKMCFVYNQRRNKCFYHTKRLSQHIPQRVRHILSARRQNKEITNLTHYALFEYYYYYYFVGAG